jgi:ubiquitin-protein ligase
MHSMNIRDKRLENDFKGVSNLVANSGGTLKIVSTSGKPPHTYVIEYLCRGIERLQGENPVFRNNHQIKISVEDSDYPRSKPNVWFLTPIFHPNVWSKNQGQLVCLGDEYWTMSETLSELILRVGRIIQYSEDVLNTRRPANQEAGQWAIRNPNRFPIDNKTFKSAAHPSTGITWTNI